MISLMQSFENFFNDKESDIKKKLVSAKKEVKNFTKFRYYLDLKKILNN